MTRSEFLTNVAAAASAFVCPTAALAIGQDRDYNLVTPTGTIYGSLMEPAGSAAESAVLIIAGSGPTDRNCNSATGVRTNAYLLLARGLAAHGVASVRYDKRGVGASAAAGPAESDLRFGTYVSDTASWLRKIRAEGKFTRIAIAGHSEGSLVGMIAGQEARIDAFVSLEGAGFPAPTMLRAQLRKQLSAYPDLQAANERILGALAGGRTVSELPAQLESLYRPTVQAYLISWFRYDPRAEIAKLRCPVTIVQGTADLQVGVENARALASALPSAKLILVPGMSHVLKPSGSDSLAEQERTVYVDPSIPIAPAVVQSITEAV